MKEHNANIPQFKYGLSRKPSAPTPPLPPDVFIQVLGEKRTHFLTVANGSEYSAYAYIWLNPS